MNHCRKYNCILRWFWIKIVKMCKFSWEQNQWIFIHCYSTIIIPRYNFLTNRQSLAKLVFLHNFETFKIQDKGYFLWGLDLLFEKLVINDWNIFERLFWFESVKKTGWNLFHACTWHLQKCTFLKERYSKQTKIIPHNKMGSRSHCCECST